MLVVEEMMLEEEEVMLEEGARKSLGGLNNLAG
jgi:hypothetical protein